MKQKTIMSLAMAVVLVASLGCKKTEEATGAQVQSQTPQTATTAEIPGTTNPNDLNPIAAQSYIDSVKTGHELAKDGTIAEAYATDKFSAGQTVHISMSVKDAPANADVKAVWYGPNETKLNEEQKTIPVGASTVTFSAKDTKTWVNGDYRAEVWIGDEKVSTQNFKIVDKADTRK